MNNSNIKAILDTLKARMIRNGSIEIQHMNGYLDNYSCIFNRSIDLSELHTLESALGYPLPAQYIEFLEYCNGCNLFTHPVYGGEQILYSTKEILEYNVFTQYPGRIRIAYMNDDTVVIDARQYLVNNSSYMYVCKGVSHLRECRPLHCDFETWLDRIVMANGHNYWNWV